MTPVHIATIVEGHGECEAVPVLLRRIAQEIDPGLVLETPHSLRIPATKLRQAGEIERAVRFAANKIGGRGGVVVLLDCDDGCPADEGPALLERARSARPDVPICVILAKREFEAWFLAAAESLRGRRNLPEDIESPTDPEAIRAAKGWLSDRMPKGRVYPETVDQAALTAVFDLGAARRADSFDKCYRDISQMLKTLACMS